MSTDDEEEESQCQKPCDPNSQCEECASYWERMIAEGYWNKNQHKWTDKGWNQITRIF